jgi:hypothetical protein
VPPVSKDISLLVHPPGRAGSRANIPCRHVSPGVDSQNLTRRLSDHAFLRNRSQTSVLGLFVATAVCGPLLAGQEAAISKDQIKNFLLTAEILSSKSTSKGQTHPIRLTLSNGTITHDAQFQPIDIHKAEMKLDSGATVLNFVDSYKFNIAAYHLAELIGMDDLVPIYVERRWQGHLGSLTCWLPVKMDEQDRVARKINPPDPEAWNKQMYKIRVFDELIYDTDANLTNILIGSDWQIWRIDFTRAFRNGKNLRTPSDPVECDRQLLEHIKTLKADGLAAKTHGYLTKEQVQGVMARRDKIVERFNQLVKEKGENAVLY